MDIGIGRRTFLAMAAGVGAGAAERRPNVLLFITDDESWMERSAYGWSKLPTPHFDRVAREGVLFTRGYAAAPSCAPSRASILTGRNFWELEQGAFIQAWLPRKFPVFPALLAEAGYATGHTGKAWGPGVYPPEGHGREAAGRAFNAVKVKTVEEGINAIDYAGNFGAFLETRKPGQPFFFWAGATEPHEPLGKENWKKLEARYGVKLEDVRVPGFVPDTPEMRRHRANLAYEICYADEQLGRMLAELERRGELENTFVIVTADNGSDPSQALRSKTTPYDWGVHVPLAMRWGARVKGGRKVEDFVKFPDLAPTILEAAGVGLPAGMTGRSLVGMLVAGKQEKSRDHVVTGLEWHGEFSPASRAARMIRDKRFCYVVNYGQPPGGKAVPREELYDLEADPWERRNLAGMQEYEGVRRRLAERLRAYQLETRDPRATGRMEIFDATRQFVEKRKREGYGGE